ncbi:MAG: hypothetical protein E5Y89_05195 [Mesorhizobium sp.]|nr:MAG: hypothetical protein E5Y89_05195 [Mesorhizobium sp.]TIW29540.1 MAG: hypothetical protein E5V63_00730 [Mesorhizobium sp.]
MTNASTTETIPATLSEPELFAEFLADGVILRSPSGREMTWSANDMFSPSLNVILSLSNCLEEAREALRDEDSPSTYLELAEGDLRSAADFIKVIREEFHTLMAEREIGNIFGLPLFSARNWSPFTADIESGSA